MQCQFANVKHVLRLAVRLALTAVLFFQLFLSRFQFINEILFPPTEEKQKTVSKRKVRKD